jgi:hypothetical protein
MAYSTTLPILGGLAILAAVSGVSLGRSAISEINPVHFKPASSHFYSDLVPYRGGANVQPDLGASDYVEPDYAYSASPVCAGCDNYPVDYRPRHDKAVDGQEDGRSASAALETVSTPSRVPEPPAANRQWIERYTTYTIVTEPVEVEEAPPAREES